MSRPLPPHTKRLTPGCQKLHYDDLHRLAVATKRIDDLEHALALAESQIIEERDAFATAMCALADKRTAAMLATARALAAKRR